MQVMDRAKRHRQPTAAAKDQEEAKESLWDVGRGSVYPLHRDEMEGVFKIAGELTRRSAAFALLGSARVDPSPSFPKVP